MKESWIRERGGKKKYDLSKSFNICGCCGACSRLCVLCGRARAGLEVLHQRAQQPIVCYESGEHAPGKKRHYSVKYGSIIKPGASLPFVTPLPRRLTWCCSSPPIIRHRRHSQLTRVQLLVAERGCRLLFLYLARADLPWVQYNEIYGSD
jgi:hypothetical protein